MNLDEFRALKAAEESQKDQSSQQKPEDKKETDTPATPEVKSTETKKPEDAKPPEVSKIVVDGKEYTPEQIKEFEAGYLRTQDYTKKTQDAARIRREAEQAMRVMKQLYQNPQAVQQLGLQVPNQSDIDRQRLEDELVQREVDLLSYKYKDFDVKDALDIASTRPGMSLEDAYLLSKARKPVVPPVSQESQKSQAEFNIEEIKEQIRKELLKEIETNQTATQSIITSNDSSTPVKSNNDIKLTEAELEFCRKSRTDPEVYKKDKLRLIQSKRK